MYEETKSLHDTINSVVGVRAGVYPDSSKDGLESSCHHLALYRGEARVFNHTSVQTKVATTDIECFVGHQIFMDEILPLSSGEQTTYSVSNLRTTKDS